MLEINWLIHYLWLTETVIDYSKEFSNQIQETIHYEYRVHYKLITIYNPQTDAIVERIHQTVHNIVRFKI